MTVQQSTQVRNVRNDSWQVGAIEGCIGLGMTAWSTSLSVTAYTSWVQNSNNVYVCIQSGTTSSSPGGPTGTTAGAQITDGTAKWLWIGTQGIGNAAGDTIRLYTGAQPSNCAATETGTLLATFTMPVDWSAASSSGIKSISGLPSAGWATVTAGNTGTAAHYRIYDPTGTTCHEQGSVTNTGGGGDATVSNTSIQSGQTTTLTSFSRTAYGA
jgi:hypothetical protein